MNIYFACSITGGRDFEAVYQALTEALLADGHEVPTAYLAQPSVIALEAQVSPREVYERDVHWIESADALIAEVSVPSHGAGYEIGCALSAGKPVLCLWAHGRKVSKMITGNPHRNLKALAYQDTPEAVRIVREFLSGLHQHPYNSDRPLHYLPGA